MDTTEVEIEENMKKLKEMTAETSKRVEKTNKDLKGILKKVNGKPTKTQEPQIGGE